MTSVLFGSCVTLVLALVWLAVPWGRVISGRELFTRIFTARSSQVASELPSAIVGTRVTCEDVLTGESETKVIRDDYLIVTDGRMEIASLQVYANGSTQVWLKRAARA